MTKLKLLLLACLLILLRVAVGQSYQVRYYVPGVDSSIKKGIDLKDFFFSAAEARYYITALPQLLQSKGYITASVDSTAIDSIAAYVQLFLGQQYKWAKINTTPIDEDILSAIHWPKSSFKNSGMDWGSVKSWQEQILD